MRLRTIPARTVPESADGLFATASICCREVNVGSKSGAQSRLVSEGTYESQKTISCKSPCNNADKTLVNKRVVEMTTFIGEQTLARK